MQCTALFSALHCTMHIDYTKYCQLNADIKHDVTHINCLVIIMSQEHKENLYKTISFF